MEKVYFSHDGAVDDFISLFLLLQMENVELIGVGAIGADSYVEPAVSVSRKIIDRFGHGAQLEVAQSNSRPAHPFPKEWRLDSYSENNLAILNEQTAIKTPLADKLAHEDLADKLMQSTEPVTLVMTGPLSDLARALKLQPAISTKIKRIVWMGGTFMEAGNVAEPDSDGTQEWNAFWDPEATKIVFDTDIPIEMVALESTINVPLTNSVRNSWAQQHEHVGLDFLANSYAFVPELNQFETNSTYYLWDVLTTCYFYDASLVQTKRVNCDVSITAPSDGRTFLKEDGRPVTLVHDVDNARFFQTIQKLAKRADD
ncbi:nucleoside hydrolase [Bombilactobacillus thymidiniphilus]|uniref:Nucleoside hydrolase n=1 Tax=Bombilactobacillus thymidiniphilus TaxID=2923363 RepID=A0ABY4PBZ7_9LACO|nr:nucleoside hydrolase [Bombilactobacillus thymidiniphilus]UQS83079.1 nucleoside hydrolase [Bombilactobacillus thymidiniphilus]